MTKAKLAAVAASVAGLLAASAPALANDHLANATGSPGAGQRGFGNPVATNPSGTSGPQASPLTVPGQGDPSAGQNQGTPATDLDCVSARTGGQGDPQAPADATPGICS